MLNVLLPERLAYRILILVQSRREKGGKKGKFPAYYRWCRCPLSGQFRRLESVGFRVVRYLGFFGHSGYYQKVPWLKALSGWLQRHPVPWLISFAYVVVEKP